MESVKIDRYETLKVDRNALSIISLDKQKDEEKKYWKSKSPHERLRALETTRVLIYGLDSASARIQNVLEITDQEVIFRTANQDKSII